jgi:hypothetical protein
MGLLCLCKRRFLFCLWIFVTFWSAVLLLAAAQQIVQQHNTTKAIFPIQIESYIIAHLESSTAHMSGFSTATFLFGNSVP